jgi:hypothetical protein
MECPYALVVVAVDMRCDDDIDLIAGHADFVQIDLRRGTPTVQVTVDDHPAAVSEMHHH